MPRKLDTENLGQVVVRELAASDLRAAIGLTVRAMSRNPLHIAALGANTRRRDRVLSELFNALLRDGREIVGAYLGREIVGVLAFTRERGCLPALSTAHRFASPVFRSGWRAARLGWWLAAWASRDPARPHSHLGPVAVAPELQGQGIGSALVRQYIDTLRVEAPGIPAYLETDSSENARFYSRFGFRTTSTARVLGVTNWFMLRDADC